MIKVIIRVPKKLQKEEIKVLLQPGRKYQKKIRMFINPIEKEVEQK